MQVYIVIMYTFDSEKSNAFCCGAFSSIEKAKQYVTRRLLQLDLSSEFDSKHYYDPSKRFQYASTLNDIPLDRWIYEAFLPEYHIETWTMDSDLLNAPLTTYSQHVSYLYSSFDTEFKNYIIKNDLSSEQVYNVLDAWIQDSSSTEPELLQWFSPDVQKWRRYTDPVSWKERHGHSDAYPWSPESD